MQTHADTRYTLVLNCCREIATVDDARRGRAPGTLEERPPTAPGWLPVPPAALDGAAAAAAVAAAAGGGGGGGGGDSGGFRPRCGRAVYAGVQRAQLTHAAQHLDAGDKQVTNHQRNMSPTERS